MFFFLHLICDDTSANTVEVTAAANSYYLNVLWQLIDCGLGFFLQNKSSHKFTNPLPFSSNVCFFLTKDPKLKNLLFTVTEGGEHPKILTPDEVEPVNFPVFV